MPSQFTKRPTKSVFIILWTGNYKQANFTLDFPARKIMKCNYYGKYYSSYSKMDNWKIFSNMGST